jgi:peptide/nickel transport system ATP-binding protein
MENVPATQSADASAKSAAAKTVLEVEGLKTYFFVRQGIVKAVDDISFSLNAGEKLAIVGESGCGKSMTALSILRLVPDPPGRIVAGSVRLDGRDLLKLPDAEMRKVRGNHISMIFQEPMTSLNPVWSIGHQIGEALMLHQNLARSAAFEKAVDASAGEDSRAGAARAGISSPAFRRDAAAGDDRDGARLQSTGVARG